MRYLWIACLLTAALMVSARAIAAPSVAVIPIDDPEADISWGPGLAAVLTDALSHTTAYVVLPDQQVLDALGGCDGTPPSPANAATQFGADVIVSGRMDRADGLRLELELFGDIDATIAPIEADGCAALLQSAAAAVTEAFGLPENTSERLTEDDTATEAFMEARYYHCNGDLDDALNAYDSALVDRAFALAEYQMATLLREAGRWPAALGHYKEAVSAGFGWPRAEANLGAMHFLLGDRDRAQQAWEAVAAGHVDPLAIAYATNNLGTALLVEGETFAAEKQYHLALSIYPEYAMATANLGLAARLDGDYEDAERYFKSAGSSTGDLTAASFAEKCWGDMLRIQEQYEDAVSHYQRALALRPDYSMAYLNMGVTLKQMGREEEAEEAYREAITLDNDRNASAYAHNNLGNLYMARSMYRVAAGEYQRALEYKPDYAAARDNLAKAQARIQQQ